MVDHLGKLVCIALCHLTLCHCIPVSFLSEFCSTGNENIGQLERTFFKVDSNLKSHPSFGNEILLRQSPSSTTVVWSGSEAVSHIIRPNNNSAFIELLQKLSQHFHHNENIRVTEPEHAVKLICTPDNFGRRTMDNDLMLPMDKEVYFAHLCRSSPEVDIELYEFYNVGDTGLWQKLQPKVWITKESMLNTEVLLNLANRRVDLHGLEIRAVAQEDHAYDAAVHSSVSTDGTVRFTSGYNLYPFYDFQFMLNFSYVPIAGKGWIGRTVVGNLTKLTGMAEQLIEKEADLSISFNFLADWRAEQIYFLPPINYENGFAFYRDAAAAPSYMSMMKPFSATLWVALSIAIFALWITYVVFAYVNEYNAPRRKNTIKGNATMALISIMTSQGYNAWISVTSLRAVLFAGLVTSCLIQCFYSASIMAFLFIPSTYIHNANDLPKRGYTTITSPVHHQYALSLFTDPADQRQLLADSDEYYESVEDAINKILDDNHQFALVTFSDYFYGGGLQMKIKESDLCSISSVRNAFAKRQTEAMALRRGSPLRELLTQKTIKVVDSGLAYRYKLIHDRHTKVACDKQIDKQRRVMEAVTLRQCACAFGVFILGIFLALVSVLWERRSLCAGMTTDRTITPHACCCRM